MEDVGTLSQYEINKKEEKQVGLTMLSLHALMLELGIHAKFDRTLDEYNVPEAEIIRLRRAVGDAILEAVVAAGNTVIDDRPIEIQKPEKNENI